MPSVLPLDVSESSQGRKLTAVPDGNPNAPPFGVSRSVFNGLPHARAEPDDTRCSHSLFSEDNREEKMTLLGSHVQNHTLPMKDPKAPTGARTCEPPDLVQGADSLSDQREERVPGIRSGAK